MGAEEGVDSAGVKGASATPLLLYAVAIGDADAPPGFALPRHFGLLTAAPLPVVPPPSPPRGGSPRGGGPSLGGGGGLSFPLEGGLRVEISLVGVAGWATRLGAGQTLRLASDAPPDGEGGRATAAGRAAGTAAVVMLSPCGTEAEVGEGHGGSAPSPLLSASDVALLAAFNAWLARAAWGAWEPPGRHAAYLVVPLREDAFAPDPALPSPGGADDGRWATAATAAAPCGGRGGSPHGLIDWRLVRLVAGCVAASQGVPAPPQRGAPQEGREQRGMPQGGAPRPTGAPPTVAAPGTIEGAPGAIGAVGVTAPLQAAATGGADRGAERVDGGGGGGGGVGGFHRLPPGLGLGLRPCTALLRPVASFSPSSAAANVDGLSGGLGGGGSGGGAVVSGGGPFAAGGVSGGGGGSASGVSGFDFSACVGAVVFPTYKTGRYVCVGVREDLTIDSPFPDLAKVRAGGTSFD